MPEALVFSFVKFSGQERLGKARSHLRFTNFLRASLNFEILTGDHDSDPRPAPDNTAKMGIDIVSGTMLQRRMKRHADFSCHRPTTSTRRERKSQNERDTRADTDTTHSNGHRKAPKSNNDYKLLLFAKPFVLKTVGMRC